MELAWSGIKLIIVRIVYHCVSLSSLWAVYVLTVGYSLLLCGKSLTKVNLIDISTPLRTSFLWPALPITCHPASAVFGQLVYLDMFFLVTAQKFASVCFCDSLGRRHYVFLFVHHRVTFTRTQGWMNKVPVASENMLFVITNEGKCTFT